MSRHARLHIPGGVYYAAAEASDGVLLLEGMADGEDFLRCLEQLSSVLGITVHAFCLLPRRYHLLVESPRGNLSQGMRRLNRTFTSHYNSRRRRAGALKSRYRSAILENSADLREAWTCLRALPLGAGLCQSPENWPWSAERFLRKTPAKRPGFLRQSALGEASMARQAKSVRFRLNRGFLDGIKSRLDWTQLSSGGNLALQNGMDRPPLSRIFGSPFDPSARDGLILKAYRDFGYTMAEIAIFLGLHYTTISKALARLRT